MIPLSEDASLNDTQTRIESRDVYIKLRVELMKDFGNHSVFVMSFHYAEKPFTSKMFPYREK